MLSGENLGLGHSLIELKIPESLPKKPVRNIKRQQMRRGLLKGEQIHALARQVAYGKQGKLSVRDLEAMRNTSSCLTLIMASIIYWQAREINRVILECDPEGVGVDLSLLEHVSPIGWSNVILYGEYVLNRDLVRL